MSFINGTPQQVCLLATSRLAVGTSWLAVVIVHAVSLSEL